MSVLLKLLIGGVTCVSGFWLGAWLKTDGFRDEDLFQSQMKPESSDEALSVAASWEGAGAVAAEEALRRLQSIDGLPDTMRCHILAMDIIDELDVSEYSILSALLLEQKGEDWSLFRAMLLLKWIESDEESFFAYMGSLDRSGRAHSSVRMALRYAGYADAALGKELRDLRQELDDSETFDPPEPAKVGVEALEHAIAARDWERGKEGAFVHLISQAARESLHETLGLLKEVDDGALLSKALAQIVGDNGIEWDIEGLNALLDFRVGGVLSGERAFVTILGDAASRMDEGQKIEGMKFARENLSDLQFVNFLNRYRVVRNYVPGDAVEMLNLLGSLPYSKIRDNRLQEVILGLSREDWDEGFAFANELMPRSLGLHSQLVMMAANKGRLEEALSVVESWKGHLQYDQMVDSLENSWGRESPEAYLEWALVNLEGNRLSRGTDGVVGSWYDKDPEGALEFMELLPQGDLRAKLETTIGLRLNYQSYERAIEFAESVSSPQAKSAILSRAVGSLAQQNPREAIEYAGQIEFEKPRDRLALFESILSAWGNHSVYEAVDFVRNSGDDALNSVGVKRLGQKYFKLDEEAALDWLKSVPSGVERDRALSGIMYSVSQSEAYTDQQVDELLGMFSDPQYVNRFERQLESKRRQQ
ncbi:MAG: hypothetical protein AAGB46_08400 [Verrucomicrobiota bacterium]